VRAERTQNPRDLFAGLNFACEALSRDPRNGPARYNAALALQMIGLDEQAALEWKAFLAVDSTSSSAREARRRMEELITGPVAIPILAPGASPAEVGAFARDYPQQARELGFDRILAQWGTAVERGQKARADSMLTLAEALGLALTRREGGDASLADAVRGIRVAQADAAATMALARAHHAYSDGLSYLYVGDAQRAMVAFTRVIEGRPDSPVLLQWVKVFLAATPLYLGPEYLDQATRELEAQLPRVNDVRYPALAGRSRLMLGTMLTRSRQPVDAQGQFRAANTYLERAGEAELAANSHTFSAEAAYPLGDTLAAYASAHRALRALRRDHRPNLHKHLLALGRFVEDDKLPYAALAIYNEDGAVARRWGRAVDNFEVHIARARVKRIVGDSVGAARDLDSAAAWVPRMPDDPMKEWSRASMRVASPVGVSDAQMDSAVQALAGSDVWLLPAFIWRADQRLAADDVVGAAADLDTVTSLVRAVSSRRDDLRLRAAVLEQARSFFDRLVMLHVRKGRADEALRTLERGRISFARGRAGEVRPGEGRLVAPHGQVAVEYALIGDTLLTWTIGTSIHFQRQTVDRDTFLLAVEQANAALESADAPLPRAALRRLYTWLIRPVRNHLGRPGTPLVILADGEVAGVPFAALMDGDLYLVEDQPLRFASTLEDAARPLPRGSGPELLVADPAFDADEYPMLDPLPGASAEAGLLQTIYGNAVRLEGNDATRGAFLARARRASLIHYAGHAVFDDARPERSYLLLAGEGTTGRLTAEAVDSMRLDGAPLVVLSACRTLSSRSGRSGGFAGLSGALLSAGAGGVVGSLWEVNDQLAQPLMEAFHREYQRGGDPANALRNAQLRMLRSRDPKQRSPAGWAGFRYTGS
jgi:CHAT domain-containing protein/tetratricopeptide (TPR) repeat protein